MIVTLCGFMGVGKSTLGRGLAANFNCRFIDLDEYIEDKFAVSVSQLFAKIGEEGFREQESVALRELIEEYNYLNAKEPYTLVLALGGGTVTYAPSAEIVRRDTYCIYLQCPKEILLSRLIKNNSRRPLLAGKTDEQISRTIDELMLKREHLYISNSRSIYNVGSLKLQEQLKDFAQKYDIGSTRI